MDFWDTFFDDALKTFMFRGDRKNGLRNIVRAKNFVEIVEGGYE